MNTLTINILTVGKKNAHIALRNRLIYGLNNDNP